mmetsp:Transcript_11376/g.29327  ORF Transcript_11376/g.29327 Transcript_11376/m.29327 type:complete len:237 (-) Transcript_11376:725-1435(-)
MPQPRHHPQGHKTGELLIRQQVDGCAAEDDGFWAGRLLQGHHQAHRNFRNPLLHCPGSHSAVVLFEGGCLELRRGALCAAYRKDALPQGGRQEALVQDRVQADSRGCDQLHQGSVAQHQRRRQGLVPQAAQQESSEANYCPRSSPAPLDQARYGRQWQRRHVLGRRQRQGGHEPPQIGHCAKAAAVRNVQQAEADCALQNRQGDCKPGGAGGEGPVGQDELRECGEDGDDSAAGWT